MKNLIVIFILSLSAGLLSLPSYSQAPGLLSYQAVIRDASGTPLVSAPLTLRMGIRSNTPGGTLLWQEDQSTTTSPQGLVSLRIGDAVNRTGGSLADFGEMEWGTGPRFLQVQLNTGSGFTDMGTTELVSVPYALYAREAAAAPGSDIWSANGNQAITMHDVGIGTELPAGKLEVVGNGDARDDDPLFEVKRHDGQPVFSVYNEGVRIWVKDDWAKGTKGGFAVGGFNPAKGETNEFLRVTPDSVRIYVENPEGKASKGGFAVGGFNPAKTESMPMMQLTRDNYFLGHRSGEKNTSGVYNSFMGYEAGSANSEGSYNTFLGYQAGLENNGDANIFLGWHSGKSNTTGFTNVYIGERAGYSNTTGHSNVMIGSVAGTGSLDGEMNTYLGRASGANNANGKENTYLGAFSAYENYEGSENTSIGYRSGNYAENSHRNVFIGSYAGYGLPWNETTQDSCYENTFIGYKSGYSVNKGAGNIFLGAEAGLNTSDGNHNVMIGTGSGLHNLSGSNNIFIGPHAGEFETESDKLYIDNASGDKTSVLVWGDMAQDDLRFNANVGINKDPDPTKALDVEGTIQATEVTATSDARYKTDIHTLEGALETIQGLRGVSYSWNTGEYPGMHFQPGRQIGMIAQEVEEVVPGLVHTGSDGYKSLNYSKIPAILVEAVKEQQEQIRNQEARIQELEALVRKLVEE